MKSTNITAKIAHPCRTLPTILPNVYVSAAGINRIENISMKLPKGRPALEGVRGVDVEEPAAVRPELLDRDLTRDRTTGEHLLESLDARRRDSRPSVWTTPWVIRTSATIADERKQDVDGAADRVAPEVPDLVALRTG